MTADHLRALLAAHWRLLWILNPAERARRLEEIRLDYLYERTLNAVADAVREP